MHEAFLFESKKRNTPRKYPVNIPQIELISNSFDAVEMIHLVGQLSKQEGIEMTEKAERWAKKKVIIASPNGLSQDAYDDTPYQRHVSGWLSIALSLLIAALMV